MLAALNLHYDRLADRDAAPSYGYSTEGIGFAIILQPDGSVSSVRDLREPSGKKRLPLPVDVPRSFKRPGVTPRAYFLWDNTKFALGLGKDKTTGETARYPAHFAAFRELHEQALSGTDEPALLALLAFLQSWAPENLPPDVFTDQVVAQVLDQNVAFSYAPDNASSPGVRFLHQSSAARQIWQRQLAAATGASGTCLITGQQAPTVRLHPSIKGVWGAQSSGASLVSFNLDAFESYGKEQGDNSPVSEAAAFGYGTALNALLARASDNRVQVGDASVVFWVDASRCGEEAAKLAEAIAAERINPPFEGKTAEDGDADHDPEEEAEEEEDDPSDEAGDTYRLKDSLERISAGRPDRSITPDVVLGTRFFVLGLSPNVARVSVRFWHETTLGAFVRTFDQHWHDMRIEPAAWKAQPSAQALLFETALQRKAENIPKLLGGELMRAILTGGRYPRLLLSATLQRIRADGKINGRRAAICKAWLARHTRFENEQAGIPEQEDNLVSLDRDQTDPAYLMGRLFAVLESVQRAALGKVNASIRDRYFGAASATPASVFPLLLRGANHHLSVLRKKSDAGGLAVWFEREMGEIVDKLSMDLPRHLRLEDQGRFVVGYYHQRNARKTDDDTAAPPPAEDEATAA
ncbi:CRISPR-associated protein Csd1 [Skermanella stibiiresistens SB22]|uniref:CRISPR-associated protein Csd1 n=2 Tax=Skermanella TaxID=204447 RepID=W9H7N3_9PROT|nr:CRISPR-associated protein Csd1 [Skermanella stibiiresistens SB22]